jgi:hypothetical protein
MKFAEAPNRQHHNRKEPAMGPWKKLLTVSAMFLFLIPALGCPNNDDNNNSLTPSTQGVGVSTVKAFTEVAGFAVQLIDGIDEAAGVAPPVAKADGQPRDLPPSIPCDSGQIQIDDSGLVDVPPHFDFMVSGEDCVADGGSLAIKAGTTGSIYPADPNTCTANTITYPAPQNFVLAIDGTVTVDSTDFNLTGLQIAFAQVQYDGSSCKVSSFSGNLTGGVSNGATINFTVFPFLVQITGGGYFLDISNGSMTVDTPCDNDTYTLDTSFANGGATLSFSTDASCPYAGILNITKASTQTMTTIDFTADPGACDAQACQAG